MKYFFTLLSLLIGALSSYSQILKYVEDPAKADVYSKGDEKTTKAAVTIESHHSLSLTFGSVVGGKIPSSSIEVETLGNKNLYKVEVDRGSDFTNDELIITSPEHEPLRIPLKGLEKKQTKYYYVEDPNDPEGKSCYLKNKNIADKSFKDAFYDKAKEEYRLTLECWDAPNDSYSKNRLMTIDSIINYIKIAESALSLFDYRRGAESYSNAFFLNPYDIVLEKKKNEASMRFSDFCADCYNTAESYFNERDYNSAKTFYSKILSQNCPKSFEATQRIKEIEIRQTQNYHVLSYEYATNAPFGISSGNYKEHHKSSGYFTLRFNPNLFDVLRDDYESVKRTELNVSFGWTLEVYKPIWVFFGPGYTGVGEYVYEENEKSTAAENDVSPKFTIYSAVSPEIGLLGKIPIARKDRIVLRYTFQYRYAFEKENDDLIGRTRHVFGIGLCF
jgi:hypothetical protein